MNTMFEVLGLLLGFALLIKGADIFVDASVNIAYRLKIPTIIIGLTVIAFGTSAPELVISVSAAISGHNSMAISNIVGSNIYNLVMIVGLCALIRPIIINLRDLAKDYWTSIIAAVLLLIMMIVFTDTIPRLASSVFLIAFFIYMIILVVQAMKNRITEDNSDADTVPLPRNILLAILGVALLIAGGQITVSNGVNLALSLGITERVIGLTVIAIGTSLPELITTLIACKKQENDIAIGNIVGSNIFNILFILGLSGIITPLPVDSNLIFDLVVLVAGSLLIFVFGCTGKRISRPEGLTMVSMYSAYMVWVIFL